MHPDESRSQSSKDDTEEQASKQVFTEIKSPSGDSLHAGDPFSDHNPDHITENQIQHMEREAGDGQNDSNNEKREWQRKYLMSDEVIDIYAPSNKYNS